MTSVSIRRLPALGDDIVDGTNWLFHIDIGQEIPEHKWATTADTRSVLFQWITFWQRSLNDACGTGQCYFVVEQDSERGPFLENLY